ncbi:hydroxycarboxylic acid receptor 2-like [Engraulis encrasicolus]|uniref:hydroxycarboxylic acid receptor 2-like n=1 Tax=Engraulis encrasicolus TaxID=184585 RepID=UPI002FD05797
MVPNACCPYQGKILPVVLPPFIITELVLGVLGNSLALWILCRHMRPWKSSTVLLFNLALADFLLNAVLPFRASYYFYGLDWRFGDGFCRVFLFLVSLNRNGSIAFLTLIALDRYVRVLHPHHRLNSTSVGKATGLALAVWAITAALNAHLLAQPQHMRVANSTQCESFRACVEEDSAAAWYKATFVVSFFGPLALLMVCSIRIVSELRRRHLDRQGNMKRALFSLAAVVVLFFVCFLPSNVAQAFVWVKVGSMVTTRACKDVEVANAVFYSMLTLTYLNSALDPVVYYFSNPAFQRTCRRLLLRSDGGHGGAVDSNSQE